LETFNAVTFASTRSRCSGDVDDEEEEEEEEEEEAYNEGLKEACHK
jgi:hypothetical protein